MEILEIKAPYIRLSVTCSAGTYIRALGRDLGKEAGCLLTMDKLVRTEMGPFSLKEAKTLEEIEKNPEGALLTDLHPILSALPQVEISAKEAAGFLQGKRLRTKEEDLEKAAIFSEGNFLGIASISKKIIHPKKVFN